MKHLDQRIQAFLDGELPPAEALAVERHVRSCASCRRALEARRALWERIDGLAARPLPEIAAWPRLARRLERRGRSGWTWPARGLALAAMLAGMALGWQLGRTGASFGAADDTANGSGYLTDSQPSLDQLWLQVAVNGETGS